MQKILFGLFLAGLVFLSFMAGALLVYFHAFPYALIHRAHMGATAWLELQASEEPKAGSTSSGAMQWKLTLHVPEKVLDGYTLLGDLKTTSAWLVDMQGKVVHSWTAPYSKVFASRGDDRAYRWEDAHLYPNGDVLAIYSSSMQTPYGAGLVRLDKDSRVLWALDEAVHHKMDVGEDGRIYVLTSSISNEKPQGADYFNTPFINEDLVILSPEGRELQRISIVSAFLRSGYAAVLTDIDPRHPKGDYLHVNDVEVLRPSMAKAFPQFRAGYLLVSLRNIHAIAVIDPKTETVVWAMKGLWKSQHDPDFLPNGKILLFDNRGPEEQGVKQSRLLQVDTVRKEVTRVYGGDKTLPFYTSTGGRQQYLPNGNIVYVSSNEGIIEEIDAAGSPVWRLSMSSGSRFSFGHRYSQHEIAFK